MSALAVFFLAIPPAVSAAISATFSFAATLVLTPILIALSNRLQLFDPPGPLKIHSRPVSRIGGAALVLGFLVGVVVSNWKLSEPYGYALLALVILWLVGFLDDLFGLPVWFRLGAQTGVASLLWFAGWRLPLAGSGWTSYPALIVFCIVFINAFNFLDGADGLASSVALAIAAGFFVAFSLISSADSPGPSMAASLAGACAAFLIFNFPPARIFLGDSGSTLLGFAFALLALEFYRVACAAQVNAVRVLIFAQRHATPAILFPAFVSLLPLIDFFFAVFRRLRRGASPLAGDRRHFYDLLLARGWTPGRVAITSAAVTGVLAALGCRALRLNWERAAGLFLWTVLLLGVVAGWLGAARSEDGSGSAPQAP